MNRRFLFPLAPLHFLALLLVFAACSEPVQDNSNTPACAEGEILSEETGQCVDENRDNQDDPDDSQNQEELAPDLASCDHPWQDRDQLDPWGDYDGDTIPNIYDNCPFHPNTQQIDNSGDGIGDACSRCPFVADVDQNCSLENPLDERGVRMGDHCAPGVIYVDSSTDTDEDGVPDLFDNCPEHPNPDQADTDEDGIGDVCDNCPTHYNPDQSASEENGKDHRGIVYGDVCTPGGGDLATCGSYTARFNELPPNVYLSIDISGSMGGSRWTEAKAGLDQMAMTMWNDARFGVGTFPDADLGSCSVGHILDVGQHLDEAIMDSYSELVPLGLTPTYAALRDIIDNDRLSIPGDVDGATRPKAVVLVTDGTPTCSPSSTADIVSVITELRDMGILTFVVGFHQNSPTLDSFAEAGGTEEAFSADDSQSLTTSIVAATEQLVTCSFVLDPIPDNPDQLWVSVDGQALPLSTFSYDPDENILTIEGKTCADLHEDGVTEVEIQMGCEPAECVPEEPRGLCDLYYRSCGFPRDCESCSPEICDGQDNNCNGEIDEGCPDCKLRGHGCHENSDCCGALICNDDNFCDYDCFPEATVCTSDDQCCSGTCEGVEDGPGACL